MRVLVTGSSGLIGSEVVTFFESQGHAVFGWDNNMRESFFGKEGSTLWNLARLQSTTVKFTHHDVDIRARQAVMEGIQTLSPLDLIVHCAAQPSHDLAAQRPFDDFDVNAVGTLNLLEAFRRFSPQGVFVFLSTNKVYGDTPNDLTLIEHQTRWDYADERYRAGIDETMTIDHSKHSIFGASKVAADVMVQEYGRYFNLRTTCLRGGCLTGPNHSGVQAHGFLSYLVKCNVAEQTYNIFGYLGKQVRDNIHSHDVVRAINAILESPRMGEVYNLGGGRTNSCSILEAFEAVTACTGKKMDWIYVDKPRSGDHICYITDMGKFKDHYPDWKIEKGLEQIIEETSASWIQRLRRD